MEPAAWRAAVAAHRFCRAGSSPAGPPFLLQREADQYGGSFRHRADVIGFRPLQRRGDAIGASETVEVDPAFSSQRCSCCGFVSPLNRPRRDGFACIVCGHADHADINAARNHLRGALNQRGGSAAPFRGGSTVGQGSEYLPGRFTRTLAHPDLGIPAKIAQAS
jgi:hypothetical protein